MRLKDKVAIVVGAGQTPGDTMGNGRATAILFAREGARVVLVDSNYESALETQTLIAAESGTCLPVKADVTCEDDCAAFVRAAVEAYGRVDVLHNNVGIGGGDDEILSLKEESWDRIMSVNLKGHVLVFEKRPADDEGTAKWVDHQHFFDCGNLLDRNSCVQDIEGGRECPHSSDCA